jgi:hypothetical protein
MKKFAPARHEDSFFNLLPTKTQKRLSLPELDMFLMAVTI